MLKIAICDDLEIDRNVIITQLAKIEVLWCTQFEIFIFTSGEELFKSLETNVYDVILLDILMSGIDGIETAVNIRTIGQNCKIIFVSSYDERLRELFKINTFDFLDKPLDFDKFENCLKRAAEVEIKIFEYTKNKEPFLLNTNLIIYFESSRNKIVLKGIDFEDLFYDSLLKIWETLKQNGDFIMPHKSYIFNLKYVTVTASTVYVNRTKETFNIGRAYRTDTAERYLKYIRGVAL